MRGVMSVGKTWLLSLSEVLQGLDNALLAQEIRTHKQPAGPYVTAFHHICVPHRIAVGLHSKKMAISFTSGVC